MEQVTQILTALENGEARAEELFVHVYEELRRLAVVRLADEHAGLTLQPTALVHEVFLRLVVPEKQQQWKSTRHFFAAAAISMRRILVENARRKKRQKHGGEHHRVALELDQVAGGVDLDQLIALDDALVELEKLDPIKAKLIVLRYFGGLSIEQACEGLQISRTTAHRYWTYARAWLFQRIDHDNCRRAP